MGPCEAARGPQTGNSESLSLNKGRNPAQFCNLYSCLLGVPGEPPVRPNLSIGDTLAGMNAVPLWLLDSVRGFLHGLFIGALGFGNL